MAFCQTAVYRLACFEFLKIGYWWSWKMTFFGFWLLGFSILFFPNENQLGVHMRYHLFLHYGWFLQNLGKDFIQTNNAHDFRFFKIFHSFKKVI